MFPFGERPPWLKPAFRPLDLAQGLAFGCTLGLPRLLEAECSRPFTTARFAAREDTLETTVRENPTGYSPMQIVLHWIIAAMMIFQLLFGEGIKPAWRAIRRGAEAAPADLVNANVHVYVGIAVLVLALWRFAIRMRRGVPAMPADENRVLEWIARITHFLLYLFIFGMPITGILMWYFGLHEVGEIHEAAKPVIIVAVGLHAAGALWQHLVAKTNVLRRMLKPGRA